jgi:hypothetical protein
LCLVFGDGVMLDENVLSLSNFRGSCSRLARLDDIEGMGDRGWPAAEKGTSFDLWRQASQ